MASQIEQWFRLADEDRDGGVGGAEAVKFFTKSGLPQDVLGQIWEYSSNGAAKLNIMQFGVAMRLVALAQASGSRLDPNQARLIAMGGGPQLPPPRLAGITGAPAPSITTYTPQITGLGPQGSIAAGPTGGLYVPQPTGGPYAPQPAGAPYVSQPTGGYVAQMTGGPRPPLAPGYPQSHSAGIRPPGPAHYTAQPTGPGSLNSGPASGGAGGFSASGPPSAGFSAAGSSGPASGGFTGQQQQQGFGVAAAGPTGQGFGATPGSGPPSAGFSGGQQQQGFGAAAAGPTGGVAGLPGFPAVTHADMQRYQAAFLQTDTDRDGLVKGSECFPVFMLSGLDKALLKRMWDMVAGNAGSLTADQFVKCMYLMDGCRRGTQLPAVLPLGPWPQVTIPLAAAGATAAVPGQLLTPSTTAPGPAAELFSRAAIASEPAASAPLPAENWSLENQFGPKGAQKAIADAYDQTLPRIPELPGKPTFDARPPSLGGGASLVPDLDAAVADMLVPADKARWEAERSEALEKETKQREAEAEAAAAKARIEAFQQALSELIMFKSRVDVALLQASDTAARLSAEAEDTELRYNRTRLAAESKEEEGNAARQKLQALLARKQEAANKLELLQQELAMIQNLNPAELVALEKEVGKLVAEAAAAESKKAAMEMQLDSGKKQKSLLSDRISDLELAAAAGEGDIWRAREELEYLQVKVAAAQESVQSPKQLGEVGPLLGKAASAYRRLFSSAAAAGIEVPYEANLNNVGALVWLEQLMAGAADWVDDDALVSGYTVVNALPDLEGVPPALLRAAALAAEQQKPVKPVAVTAGALAQKQKGADGAPAAAAAAAAQEAEGPAAAASDAGGNDAVAAVEAPAAATGQSGSPKKASRSVKSAVTAAAAAATAAVAAIVGVDTHTVADKEQPSVTGKGEEDEQVVVPAAAAAESTADDDGAGQEAARFEDDAFGDTAAFPAEAPAAVAAAAAATPAAPGTEAAAVDPLEAAAAGLVQEVPPAADGLATAADMFMPDTPAAGASNAAAATAAAAEQEEDSLASAAAAENATVVDPGVEPAPPRESVADDDDSEEVGVTSPFSPEALSAVPAVAGGLGLSGFDPAMYRLNSEQRQLVQQQSVDSSYAGSLTGSAAAGATGASTASGFEDDAFGDSAGGGQHKVVVNGQGGAMAFEDNAF